MNCNNTPLVSIVMPSYNSGRYISKAIESIQTQNYSNLELIIVDGHSTDDTIDIVNNYMNSDKRIRLIYDEGNGIGPALNQGCMESKGFFIARMDSDDISLPNRIEEEVSFLLNNEDYVLVSSAMYYMDEKGNVIGRNFVCTKDYIIKELFKKRNAIAHPFVMFRRDAYIKSGGYPNVKIAEDALFWKLLSGLGKLKNISKPLGIYRLGGDSLQRSFNPFSKVLEEFRLKMMDDITYSSEDLDFYNNLCTYSKKYTISSGNKYCDRPKSLLEYIYIINTYIVGKKIAETINSFVLNVYFYLIIKGVPLKVNRL